MEKISDIQQAEIEIRYYEILIADAKKCESHALVAAWQKGLEAEQKHLESLYQAEQEMQHLDTKLDPDGLDKVGQAVWNAVELGVLVEGVCPCGVEGCKGLDWLLDGNEPY